MISERQGTREDRRRKFIKKIYSSDDKSIFLALSGPEERISQIYDMIDGFDNPLKKDKKTVLKQIISSVRIGENDNVSGISFIKEKSKYKTYTISAFGDITKSYEEDEPLRCYGLATVQDQAELLADVFELQKKSLSEAVDSLIQIMNTITLRYDGVGTIHNGFDIVAIKNKGEIFEKYRFQKKDLKSTITIKTDKKILSTFEKTSLKTKTKIIKRKSKIKKKKLKQGESQRFEIMSNPSTYNKAFTIDTFLATSKCSECGNELQSHEGVGFPNFGKCTSCSNKAAFTIDTFLATSKCSECGNELQPYEYGKCTSCSNNGTITS